MGQRKAAAMIQLLQDLLKAAILAKGSPIIVSRDQMARGEAEFRLKIENNDDDTFTLRLCESPDGSGPGLQLPADSPIWTPPGS